MNAARLALTGAVLAVGFPLSCMSAEPGPNAMPDMSNQAMNTLMGMDDTAAVGKVMLDQLELEGGSGSTLFAWDAQAWYGGDYDKVWLKTEGSPDPGNHDSSRKRSCARAQQRQTRTSTTKSFSGVIGAASCVPRPLHHDENLRDHHP